MLAIDADRVAMGSQLDVGGNDYLALSPKVLLVPISLGGTARVDQPGHLRPGHGEQAAEAEHRQGSVRRHRRHAAPERHPPLPVRRPERGAGARGGVPRRQPRAVPRERNGLRRRRLALEGAPRLRRRRHRLSAARCETADLQPLSRSPKEKRKMAKNFESDGSVIQWTNGTGAAIASGQMVKVGPHTLGIALVAIAIGAAGSVAIEGVFKDVPKVSGAVFLQGEKLLWDVSANSALGAFDDSAATGATGDVMGGAIAWVAGGNGETTCTVKLTPGNATLT
jgi:predicted RecA/RadA family phage recombinase